MRLLSMQQQSNLQWHQFNSLLLVMVGNMQNSFSAFNNANDKVFAGCQKPGLGKRWVPKDPELSGISPDNRIFGSIV